MKGWGHLACAAVAAAFLHRPFERGFHRRRGGVDVVTVEAKTGFQPQAVARAKADGFHFALGAEQIGHGREHPHGLESVHRAIARGARMSCQSRRFPRARFAVSIGSRLQPTCPTP